MIGHLLAALILAVGFAGCATVHHPVADPAVPVPCIDAIPPPPTIYSRGELAALPAAAWPDAMWSDRLALTGHVEVLRAIMVSCARVGE